MRTLTLCWRAAIVVLGVTGLLMGQNSVVYFTTQSNLVALAYFACSLYWMIARGTTPAPRLRGGVTLWLLITCLISHFLLNHGENPLPGLTDPDPSAALANRSLLLIHYVVPLMVLADWVAFGPHRRVGWRDVPLWVLYPLGYGLAIESRAVAFPAVPVRYPYFFLDPTRHGYAWVAGQFVQLAVVFSILGAAVVALDRLAAPRRRRATEPTPDAAPSGAELPG
jgi:hypothetical protein